MKLLHVIPYTILACLTGCASQGSLDGVRNDVDAVKSRLFTLDKDVTSIREESKASVSSVEQGFKADVAAVRKMSADIQSTIDSTKSEMQALNGKLDDISISQKTASEDVTRYRGDTDKRIFALEDRILKQQSLIDELSKKIANPPAPPVAPDASYNKGLETFKAGDMPAARDLLTKFIEQFPQHELVANAHYWIGETHYNEKNYEPAILAYQEVIKNFPGKEKVTAAMLKQAMAFNAIKDIKSARYVLKNLIENYPKSEEARRAKVLMKEIK